jgi:hypothetical protein
MFTKSILASVIFGGLAVSSAAVGDEASNKLIHNSYQQSAAVSCMGAVNDCRLLFLPMTDEKTVITTVSCTVTVTPGSFVGFNLFNFGTSDAAYLPAFVYGQDTNNGPLQAATNATTSLFFNKGGQAAVIAAVSNGGQFETTGALSCTISGFHS